MLKRILLATDGSEGALRAANAAAEVARQFKAQVLVLYVAPPAPALAGVATEAGDARWAGSSAARRGIVQAASDILARTARVLDEAGVTYATRLDQGPPAERICQVARDEGYDLIVLSHRGLQRMASPSLGSVSEQVSQCASCSVMIVR